MSVFRSIKRFFIAVFSNLLTGLCIGILGGLTFMFIRRHPFIALGLAAFFTIFHTTELKNSWKTKNFLSFFARILAIIICISAPASLVWMAIVTTYSELRSDFIDIAVLILLILIFTFGLTFISILLRYFPETRFGKAVDQFLRGSEHLTGLGDFISFR